MEGDVGMDKYINMWGNFSRFLESIGGYIPQLGLRLFLAYEFGLAGLEKFNGTNWFVEIQNAFPFPFNLLPVEMSWQLSTWFELIGAIVLVLGLATRFFSFSLVVLTIVAWVAVHAGNGYNVCYNGYKLPLMYLIMFIPLLFTGAGKLSLDHLFWKNISQQHRS